MPGEFDLIRHYFATPAPHTVLGVGDDCALMACTPGQELAVSTDMLVAGRHFILGTDPRRLGHKSAAVNLSDIAAMGATPRWVTLGLALPEPDEHWVGEFSAGFHDLLAAHGVDWVGGDTTAGPLTISVTILGEVPPRQALRRSGAVAGDDVWVSGTLGDAALGLQCLLREDDTMSSGERQFCLDRLHMPTPRVALGQALRGLAHAAIDVSDGLLADLGHILDASGVGAALDFERLPRSLAMQRRLAFPDAAPLMLSGGDDYELCFTAAPASAFRIQQAAAQAGVAVTCIGSVTAARERVLRDAHGAPMPFAWQGFDHFRLP
jgi:thiamine-monophosphate kinase